MKVELAQCAQMATTLPTGYSLHAMAHLRNGSMPAASALTKMAEAGQHAKGEKVFAVRSHNFSLTIFGMPI
jgi:hypothetical protein